jgi:hypothetical protein
MEEYYYLPPVAEGNIKVDLNNTATIRIPDLDTSTGGYYYFKNFTIYYRIYISGENNSGSIQASSEILNGINPSLLSDYTAIYPSTDTSSTSVNTAIGSLFRNRKYYEITLEGADIRDILSNSVLNRRVVIDFPPNTGSIPTLTVTTNSEVVISSHNLFRSNGEGTFQPVPNRYFQNSPDLNSSSNATATKNNDVADRSGTLTNRYTYISMYLVVVGMDANYAPIYSNPTFIGILRLPNDV